MIQVFFFFFSFAIQVFTMLDVPPVNNVTKANLFRGVLNTNLHKYRSPDWLCIQGNQVIVR